VLVALIEAKGECLLSHYRGQALVEISSLARARRQDMLKRKWEEVVDPTVRTSLGIVLSGLNTILSGVAIELLTKVPSGFFRWLRLWDVRWEQGCRC
jgi:hypothetical protein